ncbi:acetyl-CoA carboxylase biotin carboxyl carrier protein subunit [Algibacter sp. 2305UL17-15]|uniref:acetyl-CoA carboxylase biotin carboxyl carrier protein subunit n=1 Tax=Algibacter sp. 2305UL17-15 TaxID=3231268 RepID=UPI003459E00A
MSKTYKTIVNKNYEFDLKDADVAVVDVIATSENTYHALHNQRSFKVEVLESDFNSKSYTISVNNTSYTVSIKNELDVLIDKMGFSVGLKKEIKSIIAPMPGLILELNIEVGQDIKENDTLLILEAMKMENSITSPIDGVIKSINAKKGDAVEKNQLIIEFE